MEERYGLSSCQFRSSFLFQAASAAQANLHHSSNDEVDETTLPRPLNYYETLNLESPDTHRRPKTGKLHNRKKRTNYRARITNVQIKKAYRKQAQFYHPDKASRHNMTTEESTSRFAEIAEAYQVLNDAVQRYDYDWELLEMEEEYEEERLLWEEDQRERKRMQQFEEGQRYNNMVGDDSSLYEKIRNGASNFHAWKDTLNLDPWAVFEDFFFQDSTMSDDEIDPYAENHRYHQSQHEFEGKRRHRPPASPNKMAPYILETTIYRGYDPSFGADVYTVLRREEYFHDMNDNGEHFYQILGQDFISGNRADPYTGFTMQEYYSAVTEPYFVEEGYTKPDSDVGKKKYEGANFNYNNQRSEHQTQTQTPTHRMSTSKLEEGESLAPNFISNEGSASDPWVSPNGKYQAMLTPTCELQIILCDEQQKQSQPTSTYGNDDVGITVIWSSETYVPISRAHGCHLALDSVGRLVLSVDYGSGLGSVRNTVLWNTSLPKVVPHWYQDENSTTKEQPITFRHYASVDDDGVIAVYRVRERVSDSTDGGKLEQDKIIKVESRDSESIDMLKGSNSDTKAKLQVRSIIDKLGVIYCHISKSSAQQGQTKAALVWDQLRYNVGRLFAGRPWAVSSVTEEQTGLHSRHECIYSTSPVGCLAPGRNAIHLTRKFAHSLKQSVQSMDSHLDHFLSALTEPASDYDYDDNYPEFYDDDDEDLLDTLLRVTGAAGTHLGKAGMHAAQIGMNRGKKVAGKMIGKMKDRMGKHSIRWGERMAEKEEVDIFF
eukprot:CAMPEP_0172534760 /NCGR_PEP_ID=MMETSP1067-20121228/7015_1 /TAXON_ID=265564 ORGANISM="Thalassiosira punctigera, Strain Tpunct2005C2" /NCGR_SAMPLE_ID=MMETSP1067 /ASSEMBLY_ACC=CAM_ASM_000444 /LENGTH=772 /DNA_ID=CAMNT_0013319589 /DNA_START=80 /DNA_END=2398 /DNA_ORIENTATION=+